MALHMRDRCLARVAKRRVAQIMAQPDRLDQIFIQPKRARHCSGDLSDFERVRQPGAIMIAEWRNKDLCFILKPAEWLGVQNTVAIALKPRANRRIFLWPIARGGVAEGRQWRKPLVLICIEPLANAGVRRIRHANLLIRASDRGWQNIANRRL